MSTPEDKVRVAYDYDTESYAIIINGSIARIGIKDHATALLWQKAYLSAMEVV